MDRLILFGVVGDNDAFSAFRFDLGVFDLGAFGLGGNGGSSEVSALGFSDDSLLR